jgi:hypothetical protein
MEESWKAVDGYKEYEVSSRGSIRKGRRILKQHVTSNGYVRISFWRAKRMRSKLIHSLVLETFVRKRPSGMVACHNNGVRTDNRVENLRWDTQAGNKRDEIFHGTRRIGTKHHNAKISDKDVRDIRRRFVRISPHKSNSTLLAAEFGITRDYAASVAKGTDRAGGAV